MNPPPLFQWGGDDTNQDPAHPETRLRFHEATALSPKLMENLQHKRKGRYLHEKFDFLGYTFRPRRARNRWGRFFTSFSPAVSNEAAKRMRQEMRRGRIHMQSHRAFADLARKWNPALRGWIHYYGRFYKSALTPVLRHFNRCLVRWAMRKYRRFRGHQRRAEHWLGSIARREPWMFAHWQEGGGRPAAG